MRAVQCGHGFFLNFKWYVTRIAVKNIHYKVMCYDVFDMHVRKHRRHPMFNSEHNGKDLHDHLKRKRNHLHFDLL